MRDGAVHMTDSKETELIACPFCGGDGDPEEVGYTKGDDPEVHHSPGCTKCGATVGTIEQWNTRTSDTATIYDQIEALLPKDGSITLSMSNDVISLDSDTTQLLKDKEEWEKGLNDLISQCEYPQEAYDRNGPQWTSPQGNEYESTDDVLTHFNDLAEFACALLDQLSSQEREVLS